MSRPNIDAVALVTEFAIPLPEALEPPATAETSAPQGAAESPELRFRRLVDAHFDSIWRWLRGLGVPARGADDAAQQVFLIAAQKLAEITPGSERAFLFGTAMGVAANVRRALGRR